MTDPTGAGTRDGSDAPPIDAQEERRRGRIAGIVGFVAVAVFVASLGLARAGGGEGAGEPGSAKATRTDVDRQNELADLAAHADLHALGAALKGVGLLICIPVGLYLIWLVARRGVTVSAWVQRSLVVGAVLVTAAVMWRYFTLKDIADTYTSGPLTAKRAGDLIDGSDAATSAALIELAARAVFAFWVARLSLAAMRVGLLTSFLGYWGVAGACAFPILPIGDAMFISWLVSIALLAFGYWPGGRPEAWERRAAFDGPAL
ncbi:hypothetical protein DSM112329_04527 [Paraconexibacter sp. AEG42_29]|uniref:DUF4386 domain-containing protein n=1 Tax=Paraconexibacter sp. AEG42_29 TaxID=2997339 RepID=A0AAU7B279_9ACTN